jgi:hemolysin D
MGTDHVFRINNVVCPYFLASQQTLTAPIDGVVQQLSVHTIGGVVTPAQQLMVIAPREGQLEIEA